jgi:hypothetical protein
LGEFASRLEEEKRALALAATETTGKRKRSEPKISKISDYQLGIVAALV